jgi:hypothetical protein
MRIQVTKIEAPGPNDGQALPVVHFKGVSKSLDDGWDANANSDLRGTARIPPRLTWWNVLLTTGYRIRSVNEGRGGEMDDILYIRRRGALAE